MLRATPIERACAASEFCVPQLAPVVVAAAAITFLVRGGRGWFWVAVGAVAVAVVTVVVYAALNQ